MKYPEQKLDPKWVHTPMTQDIVDWCESFGQYLAIGNQSKVRNGKFTGNPKMTTSQLRKFFGEVKRIEMQNEIDFSDVVMLNPLLAYAVGRDDKKTVIKDFQQEISKAISEIKDKKDFQNFVKIFEAIVAYHKLYGGK